MPVYNCIIFWNEILSFKFMKIWRCVSEKIDCAIYWCHNNYLKSDVISEVHQCRLELPILCFGLLACVHHKDLASQLDSIPAAWWILERCRTRGIHQLGNQPASFCILTFLLLLQSTRLLHKNPSKDVEIMFTHSEKLKKIPFRLRRSIGHPLSDKTIHGRKCPSAYTRIVLCFS